MMQNYRNVLSILEDIDNWQHDVCLQMLSEIEHVHLCQRMLLARA